MSCRSHDRLMTCDLAAIENSCIARDALNDTYDYQSRNTASPATQAVGEDFLIRTAEQIELARQRLHQRALALSDGPKMGMGSSQP